MNESGISIVRNLTSIGYMVTMAFNFIALAGLLTVAGAVLCCGGCRIARPWGDTASYGPRLPPPSLTCQHGCEFHTRYLNDLISFPGL